MANYSFLPNQNSSNKNKLSSKDVSNLRNVMRLNELKQYKKANKIIDSILKKYSDVGEVLAIKGLVLSNLYTSNNRSKLIENQSISDNSNYHLLAYDYAKKAIRYDFHNHVCWHILGLIYKSDRNYNEAIKCWNQALKCDHDNLQILRDLSILQIHCRKYVDFLATRKKIFLLKSKFLREWLVFTLTQYLVKDYDTALNLLNTIENFLPNSTEFDPYEISQMILFKALIFEEKLDYQECIKLLELHETEILDKLTLWNILGRVYFLQNKKDKARVFYEKLYELNRENEIYLLCLLACHEDQEVQKLFYMIPFLNINYPPTYCYINESKLYPVESMSDKIMSTLNSNQEESGKSLYNNFESVVLLSFRCLSLDHVSSEKYNFSKSPIFSSFCQFYFLECYKTHLNSDNIQLNEQAKSACIKFKNCINIEERNAFLRNFYNFMNPPVSTNFFLIRDFSLSEQNSLVDCFKALTDKYGKSEVADHLLLKFLDKELFEKKVRSLIQEKVILGIPTLIKLLKPFYSCRDSLCSNKVKIIESILETEFKKYNEYQSDPIDEKNDLFVKREIRSDGIDHNNTIVAENSNNTRNKKSSELLKYQKYSTLFLSQHYEQTKQYEKALETINHIQSESDCIDVYFLKAKIMKNVGNFEAAVKYIEKSRSLDLADRYINTKSVKYHLLNCNIENARAISHKFVSQSHCEELYDMQDMLWEYNLSESYKRIGKIESSLIEKHKIIWHFQQIENEHMEFHFFCLRKLSNIVYISFLRMMDTVFANKLYWKAMLDIISICIDNYESKLQQDCSNSAKINGVIRNPETIKKKKKSNSKILSEKSSTESLSAIESQLDYLSDKDKSLGKAFELSLKLYNLLVHNKTVQKVVCRVFLLKKKYTLVIQSLIRLFYCGNKAIFSPILSPILAHLLYNFDDHMKNISSKLARRFFFEGIEMVFRESEDISRKLHELKSHFSFVEIDGVGNDESFTEDCDKIHKIVTSLADDYVTKFFNYLELIENPTYSDVFSALDIIELNGLSRISADSIPYKLLFAIIPRLSLHQKQTLLNFLKLSKHTSPTILSLFMEKIRQSDSVLASYNFPIIIDSNVSGNESPMSIIC